MTSFDVFNSYLKSKSAAAAPSLPVQSLGGQAQPASGSQSPGKTPTDNTGLRVDDKETVYVSPEEKGTLHVQPDPDVDYWFKCPFVNTGKHRTDPLVIRFDLSGGQDGQWEVTLDNGLEPGASYLAAVHFGKFPVPKSMTSYELTANIYLQSDPDKPLTEESRDGLLITP